MSTIRHEEAFIIKIVVNISTNDQNMNVSGHILVLMGGETLY